MVVHVVVACLFTYFCMSSAQSCSDSLQKYGVSERYPGVVAHGIHSITVEDLRSFEPTTSVDNKVPTVNRDLMSNTPILLSAPDMQRPEKDFSTAAMQVVDTVLSHMDNPKYDISQYSTLERLVHAFHMKEVWSSALIEYEKIKKTPPPPSVCQCITDIDNNGVMKMLRFTALAIREPQLMYGKTIRINNGTASWDGNIYRFNFQKDDEPIRSPSDAMPSITSGSEWNRWKKLMAEMKQSDHFELATFLYCSLNKFPPHSA